MTGDLGIDMFCDSTIGWRSRKSIHVCQDIVDKVHKLIRMILEYLLYAVVDVAFYQTIVFTKMSQSYRGTSQPVVLAGQGRPSVEAG